MIRLLVIAILVFASSNLTIRAQDRASKPKVIIIFTDDQGYQDVSVFGSPLMSTPNLDKMAANPKAKVADKIVFRDGMTLDSLREVKWRARKVPLFRHDEIIEYPVDQSTLTQRYTAIALGFIKSNQEQPFFLYLAHTMPHIPLFASAEFEGKSKRGLYGDVIEEIDWGVGRILETLETLGIAENTLVIYTSDNGPWNLKNGHGGIAAPLQGYKFETYEGGMRVPMIAQWKGEIDPGGMCNEVASTIDLLPTIGYLTDSEMSDNPIDGKNISKLLSGEKAKFPHRKEGFYYYKENTAEAVRCGDWKLRVVEDKVELFNLANDIPEANNVAEDNPKQVNKLSKKLDAFDKDLKMNQYQFN